MTQSLTASMFGKIFENKLAFNCDNRWAFNRANSCDQSMLNVFEACQSVDAENTGRMSLKEFASCVQEAISASKEEVNAIADYAGAVQVHYLDFFRMARETGTR